MNRLKNMRNLLLYIWFLPIISGCAGVGKTSNTPILKEGIDFAVPGYWVSEANPALEAVIALNKKLAPADDEIIVYYVRSDKDYEPWALWVWAVKSGDGAAAWPYTQQWTVENDIGYMRFKKNGKSTGDAAVIDSEGNMGLIVRRKDGWTKDGNDDRIWNTAVSNACIIFSGDQNTYAVGAYKMKIDSAVLIEENRILLTLNGKYGLEPEAGSDSGFVVRDKASGTAYEIADVYNTYSPLERAANYTKTVSIEMKEPLSASSSLEVYHPVFEAPKMIDVSRFIWKSAQKTVPETDAVLGMVYNDTAKSATFSLWAPTSSEVNLLLYKRAASPRPDFTVALTKNGETGVWSGTFDKTDPEGFFYEYEITNSRGTVKALDPYAKSMAAYKNTGDSGRAAVVNLKSPKALPAGGWENYTAVPSPKREDAIIYEISVRDFTISPDSKVSGQGGTYAAFIEKLPYLKELGITHIQLLPVVNFYYTDETEQTYEDSGTSGGNNYNWGYDPHNYFTPEGWYATNPSDPYNRIAELKTLIKEAHKNGIGVLLDVVYNHMAKTGFMEDIVPGYYFRTNDQGRFTSASGCGNDVATERIMARKLIVDSVTYWLDEYKVDGFRFDLMGLIDSRTMEDAYTACEQIKPQVLFLGEGWKMYNGPAGTVGMDQNYMTKTDFIAVFNDEFRDLVKAGGMAEEGKGFITGRAVDTESFFRNIIGQPQKNYRADSPGDNVQYIAAHDGLTLHDSIVHNAGINESVPAGKAETVRRLKMGNFICLTSQGIAFLHGGQERGRTKPRLNAASESIGNFVRNSYDSSDNINRIVWTLDDAYTSLYEYTRGLIALRKEYAVFRLGSMDIINQKAALVPGAVSESGFVMAYSIEDDAYTWYILMNADMQPKEIKLGRSLSGADLFADGEQAGLTPITEPRGVRLHDTSAELDGLTCALLRVKK